MKDWIEWAVGSLFLLIIGGFKYTYNVSLRVATKSDLEALKDRVCEDSEDIKQRLNLLYEHLLNRSIEIELQRKNGGLPRSPQ